MEIYKHKNHEFYYVVSGEVVYYNQKPEVGGIVSGFSVREIREAVRDRSFNYEPITTKAAFHTRKPQIIAMTAITVICALSAFAIAMVGA